MLYLLGSSGPGSCSLCLHAWSKREWRSERNKRLHNYLGSGRLLRSSSTLSCRFLCRSSLGSSAGRGGLGGSHILERKRCSGKPCHPTLAPPSRTATSRSRTRAYLLGRLALRRELDLSRRSTEKKVIEVSRVLSIASENRGWVELHLKCPPTSPPDTHPFGKTNSPLSAPLVIAPLM